MDRVPFQSIENTLEYLSLLDLTIGESSHDLETRVRNASGDRSRSGLLLALYNLSQLSQCVRKSKRIINDLNLIRTALVGTRQSEINNHAKLPARCAADHYSGGGEPENLLIENP